MIVNSWSVVKHDNTGLQQENMAVRCDSKCECEEEIFTFSASQSRTVRSREPLTKKGVSVYTHKSNHTINHTSFPINKHFTLKRNSHD
jgi:hypothetical protein